MNKIQVIFSLIAILVGTCIISISKIVEEFSVIIGRAAYQAAAAGSYSPQEYYVNLSLNYWIGSLLILSGVIVLCIISYNKYKKIL